MEEGKFIGVDNGCSVIEFLTPGEVRFKNGVLQQRFRGLRKAVTSTGVCVAECIVDEWRDVPNE